MAVIEKIIKAIDEFLVNKKQNTTTPVEINPYLEEKGLLNDSASRPGRPIRKILKKGQIPHAYQIGVNWIIPHSGDNTRELNPIINSNIEKEKESIKTISSNGHKLNLISVKIIELIEKKFNKKPTCKFEYKPDWLLSFPTKSLIENYPELSELYSELVNKEYTLTEKLSELTDKHLKQKQSFDIWIGEPFNFAIEFDEKQHFNQYRKITLEYYDKINIRFPIQLYKELNENIIIKAGKSGFTKLKSYDPLFPEMFKGIDQDNRIRQRAFRDYLKDLLPIDKKFNPTLRIPYHITNKKISNFTKIDLNNIIKYIEENDLI